MDRKITVGCLYPDVMSACGDRGNVATIVRRCGWRDIAVEVTELRLGDKVRPGQLDIVMIGGGESQQRLVAADLYKVKGAAIRDAVAAGVAALAAGGGYELFGRFCQPEKGAEIRGIELFDAWTIQGHGMPGGPVRDHADHVAADLVVRWGERLLVGVEIQSGRTYLGPSARPLGQVLTGQGNNGDGTEGCVLGSAVGTNLRGSCLPANPALADFLIGAALARRYGSAELTPLVDDLELAARDAAVERARLAAHGRVARRGAAQRGRRRQGRARRGIGIRAGVRR
jgi:lipid II isoglutaminyl synthase (glutamine-hydrolysing)